MDQIRTGLRFKPYYNWNTFNTSSTGASPPSTSSVLNLIITGIPSILFTGLPEPVISFCFKPYYNWNTFNTRAKVC